MHQVGILWASYDNDKVVLPTHFSATLVLKRLSPTELPPRTSSRGISMASCMETTGCLTCGDKGACQVGMPRAARAHKQVLNLKGIHGQAGAEMAIAHG